jgi:hypothetical protein
MPAQSPITEWFVTGETSAGIPEALAQEAASSSSRGRVRESEDELANLRDEKNRDQRHSLLFHRPTL